MSKRREEPASEGVVLLSAGLAAANTGLRFEPRKFPVAGMYAPDEPLQLTILPLDVDQKTSGFAAFHAPNCDQRVNHRLCERVDDPIYDT